MYRPITCAAAVLFVAAPSLSHAQTSATCDTALVQSTYMLNDTRMNNYRLAAAMSEQEWNQTNHDINYQGFIYGQPQKASYAEFHRNAMAKFQSSDQQMSSAEAHNLMWTGLGETSERAYTRCIDALSRRYGLSLSVEHATTTQITLRVSWTPLHTGKTSGDDNGLDVDWTAAGYPEILNDLPEHIDAGMRDFTIVRPKTDVDLTVSSGGVSDYVTLTPYVPPPPPPPAPKRPAYPITLSGNNFSAISGAEYGGPITDGYGFRYLHNGPDYNAAKRNWVQFTFNANAAGQYRLYIDFAAADPRPISITVNDQLVFPSALNFTTGCWLARCLQHAQVGIVTLRQGTNTMEFEQPNAFPHIQQFNLQPVAP